MTDEASDRIQSSYDGFRDRLGRAVVCKMDAEKIPIRSLAEWLEISISSLSQIRTGTAGRYRTVPNLHMHFRVLDWLRADIGMFDVARLTEQPTGFTDLHDTIQRLDVPEEKRQLLLRMFAAVWGHVIQ